MAHVEHFKASDIARVNNEYERNERYMDREGRIDPTRTPGNYTMLQTDMMDRLDKRLSEVPHSSRKDLNVVSTWVVTCPKEITDPVEQRRFFETVFKFTQERYGEDNVLQGYVHVDETSPHIHMPTVPEKDGRISSKALFNKRELSGYHKDLDEVIAKEFGQAGLILNGRTKGNYTVQELKARTKDKADMRHRIAKYNAKMEQYRVKKQEQDQREQEQQAEAEFIKSEKRKLKTRREALDARESDLEAREAVLSSKATEIQEMAENARKRLLRASEVEQRVADREEAVVKREKAVAARERRCFGREGLNEMSKAVPQQNSNRRLPKWDGPDL